MFLILMAGMFCFAWADIYVGSGTDTTNLLPMRTRISYSYSQQIYTQDQLGSANIFYGIYFYWSSGSYINSRYVTVYVGHTNLSSFSSNTAWVHPAYMTQVAYDYVLDYPSSPGWMSIIFSSPFHYNGTSNLVVAVLEDQTMPAWDEGYWGSFTSGENTGIYYHTDSSAPSPEGYITALGRTSNINRIRLMTPNPPGPANTPGPAHLATSVSHIPTLSWVAGTGNPTSYDVYFGTSSTNPAFIGNQTALSYTPGTLNYNTAYYWKIVPRNMGGAAEDCPIWKFTTGGNPTISSFPYNYGFEPSTYPAYGWKSFKESGNNSIVRVSTCANPTATPHTGSYMGYYGSFTAQPSSNAWLATPPINVTNTSYRYSVSFWMWRDSSYSTNADRFNIYANTSASLTGATLLGTVNRSKSLSPVITGSDGWYQYTYDFCNGSPELRYIIFQAVSAYGANMVIDDIQIFRTMTISPPNQVISPNPANLATDVSPHTSLSWSSGGGHAATGYKVYQGMFPGSLGLKATQTGTTYSLSSSTNRDYGRTYYWRIDAYNDAGTTTGQVWSFTTCDGIPVNPVPADGSTNQAFNILLDWDDVPGNIEGYRINVGTTPGGSEIISQASSNLSHYRVPIALPYDTSIYWKVFVPNMVFQIVESPVWSFTTGSDPTLVPPAILSFSNVSQANGFSYAYSSGLENTYWQLQNTANAGGLAPEFALVSPVEDIIDQWTRIISPPIDVSGLDNVELRFRHKYDVSEPGVQLKFQYAYLPDNYIDLWTHNASTGMEPEEKVFIVPTNGNDILYLSWFTYGNHHNIEYWCLDDIKILPLGNQVVEVILEGGTGTIEIPPPTGSTIPPTSVDFSGLPGDPVVAVSVTDNPSFADFPNVALGFSFTGASFGGSTISINHNLGYIPMQIAYRVLPGDWELLNQSESWTVNTATFTVNVKADGDLNVIIPEQNQTLPVELSSFTAIITSDRMVQLNWVVHSETEHLGYNVLRSINNYLSNALVINPFLIDNGIANGTEISYKYIDHEVLSETEYWYWLESVSTQGLSKYYGPLKLTVGYPDAPPIPEIPIVTALLDAYPNPFNPSTTLHYTMHEPGDVSIAIFNAKGQLIKTLSASHTNPGYYRLIWDGKDMNGAKASTGVYYYRMKSGKYSFGKKMVMIK